MARPPKTIHIAGMDGELDVEYYMPGEILVVDGITYMPLQHRSAWRPTQIMAPMFSFKSDNEYTHQYRWAPGVPHLAERGLLRG